MTRVVWIDGLAAIADRYDGFLLDVWGVIHNGMVVYPGVPEALSRLAEAGKKVILISNAPARTFDVVSRILAAGLSATLVPPVMSSGEEVWLALRDRPDRFYRDLGRRYVWLGPQRHSNIREGLGLIEVVDPAEADFLLNAGPDGLDDEVTALKPLLLRARAAGLPMICANPDCHVMIGRQRIVCAGQVARHYEAIGGSVRWHGKPYASIYRTCLATIGVTDPSRALAVGDSLRTDIAGAAGVGLDSLLLAGGIHAEEFGYRSGEPADRAAIMAILADADPSPTYLGSELSW